MAVKFPWDCALFLLLRFLDLLASLPAGRIDVGSMLQTNAAADALFFKVS